MLDNYKMIGPTAKLEVELEKAVLTRLEQMALYKKLTKAELTNTALKRFISQHKDYLPPEVR